MSKINPRHVFITAEVFRESAKLLHEARKAGKMKFSQSIVANSAFALEMYLKCLVLLETGDRSRARHDLYQLFRTLSAKAQAELTAAHDAAMAKRPKFSERLIQLGKTVDLDSLLKTGRNAFIDFRYLSESVASRVTPTTITWALNSFMSCVRARILALHPDWKLYE